MKPRPRRRADGRVTIGRYAEQLLPNLRQSADYSGEGVREVVVRIVYHKRRSERVQRCFDNGKVDMSWARR